MAGKIKLMIDRIINERSKGNAAIVLTTKTKMVLKGVNPDKWTTTSDDDPSVIVKLKQIAHEFSITL